MTDQKLMLYWCAAGEKDGLEITADQLPEPDKAPFWLDVEGLHDTEFITQITRKYGLHDLTVENITAPQRTKAEFFDDHLMMTLHDVCFDADDEIYINQICLILTHGFILSFHASGTRPFKPVWNRIKRANSRMSRYNVDYIFYGLYDAVVDQGFALLSKIEPDLDDLEEYLIDAVVPDSGRFQEINYLKKQVVTFRRVFYPFKQFQVVFSQADSTLIGEETHTFLRDVCNHAQQVNEMLDSARDRLNYMSELHNALVAEHTNRAIKFLTLVSGIFIPLSFISGVYGMNFVTMPGIQNSNGFAITMGAMVLIAGGMLWYFRKNDWL